ncbi:MAG: beta-ketoacyl synthase N-terminal-like domain-containing protein, partial [Chloroflexales bacterium]
MQSSPNHTTVMEPVAIIGMASFFAQAHHLAAYWDNIVRERNSITDVPASRWNSADYYDPDPSAPDKTYCKRGGFLPDIDFDPLEFGLPPNILEVTDVSQLLALVAARQAFEDAGYGSERGHDFERTGVVLGVCGGQKLMTPLISRLQYPVWEQAMRSCGLSEERIAQAIATIKLAYIRWEENSFPGMLGNVISGRIANRFDLGGINCVTDAACASSLSALQMALSELTEHRCDMMLTGGVDTDNSPFMYMCFSKTPAFSRQDSPRPFDATSDGMMVGEGLGMLVLKRLADAERDGDRVYAVIRGIGSSSDGRYKSIYAPRSEGQARALRRAYASAGVPAASIGLIEAHGTGTVAGDLCEVQTLRDVFGEGNPRQAHIALGSVKSQIGHTKAAAGAAGLIKAALALHHRVLPPTINVGTPNPKFGLEGSPLYVNTRPRPWLRAAGAPPRRAAVSAFGFGGTNFHVVLEEYAGDHHQPYRIHQTAQELILAASTPAALRERCAELVETLAGPQADQVFTELAEATRTMDLPADLARLGFVADGPVDAREQLLRAVAMLSAQPAAERLQHPKGVFYQRQGINTAGRVVALFPGQGSQYLEMGRELALNFPPLRELLGRADVHGVDTPLSDVLFPPPVFTPAEQAFQIERLQRTEYAQPAIGVLSAGMFGLLRDAGFRPDMVAGHSFGELTALWAAGALDDDDFLALAHARGRAMAPPADPTFDAGAMLAVSAELATVQMIAGQVPGITVANLNAHDQVVLAGSTAAISRVRHVLESAGHSATPLPVSAAFHTPLVGHAQVPFSRAIHACVFSPTRVPVYANATAQPYPADPRAMQALLADQLLQPVRFFDQIEQIYPAGGAIFVEIGPRSVLTNLVSRILGDRPHIAVALNPSRQGNSDRQLREAVVQLRVAGVPMRGIDPYQREAAPAPARKRRGLIVKLNGSNYVSEKTRADYAEAIASAPKMSESIINEESRIMTILPESEALPIQERRNGSIHADHPATPSAYTSVVQTPAPAPATPAELMAQLQAHQREILQVHQQFLSYQHEYVSLLLQLPQSAAANHEGGLAAMHQIQAETLRIHQQFLAQQGDYAAGLLQIIQQQVAQGMAMPAPLTPSPAPSRGEGSPFLPAPLTPSPAPSRGEGS